MQKEKLEFLKEKAAELRKDVITMIYEAQSGHPGGSLSAADFVAALYFSEMKVDPKNPKWPDRDRFVLSKGHACPIQYAALAELGFFDKSVLSTLRKEGSILQGHPDMKKCPGIDISTGSLGQGFACGAGMALAAKLDGKDYRVFVVIGDGESQEGEIWEAAQVCNKYKLDNIVVFCDYNNLQIDGTCDEVMPVLDLAKKFESFGFECMTIDGTVQMDIHSTSIISSIDKRLMVSCLPWTFSDYQAAEDAFFGAGGEFVSSVLAEHGLTYLGALHNGFKCMTSSKCQIKAPSDLVGQKIRTPGGDLWNGFWSALGASPQAMSWSEVYTAMQQKTIDGHDNSPSTINSANVQEVQKYITVSNHTYEAFTWSANSDWYNGLNEATQELIASCAKQACLDANKQIEDSMEKILSNWEGNGYNEIYRLSDSEIEVFKEAVASVTEQYANEYGQEACTAFGINVAS